MNSPLAYHARGAALLLFMLFFVMASVALTIAFGRSFYSDLFMYRLLNSSAQSYYTAEAGVEDMTYRFIDGMTVGTSEVLTLAGATATTTYVYDTAAKRYDIVASSTLSRTYKTSRLSLYTGAGASFNFGVQSGNGGFELTNGSSVQGNVFSNGKIEKTGGGTAWIYGDAISANASGLIKNARVSGTARAHTLTTAYIQGDAHYVTDSGSTVLGTRYTGAADEAPASLPISDADIDDIKQDVIDNGTVITAADPLCSSGTYTISSDTTIGFLKVECNLQISGNNTDVYLTGPIWVSGNITFSSGPNMHADASIAGFTVPLIADNVSDRISSSKIVIANSTTFDSVGTPKSYILLISQNNDAETGGTTHTAISVGNSSAGDMLVYAGHGLVSLSNSISLKEVTGYKITLGNSATITYESGLVNLLFTSGPGGGFTLNGWQEL